MLDGEDAIAPGDEVAARAVAVAVGHARRRRLGRAGRGQPALLPAARVQPRDDRPRPVHAACGGSASAPRAGRLPARWHRLPEGRASRGGRPRQRPARRGRRRPSGCPRAASASPTSWSPAGRRPSCRRSRSAPRHAWPSLIFGLADYSADLGLPAIGNDHPLADWARAEIVAVAGAVGVPADRRHDPRLPGRRPGAGCRPRTGRAGSTGCAWSTTTRSARAIFGHARQVGRPSRPAVRRAAGLRGGPDRRGRSRTRRRSSRRTVRPWPPTRARR